LALLFEFEKFRYVYRFEIKVGDEEEMNALAPTAPYIERNVNFFLLKRSKTETMIEQGNSFCLGAVVPTPNQIIPAFPPERRSRTHFHTPTETNYINSLPEYKVPEKIQESVNKMDYYKDLNPWKVKENWKTR
jgi:hypothetical protein